MNTHKIVKTYYWKVLTGDGLLKDPEDSGSYYNLTSLNKYSGFENKEEAEVALLEFLNIDEWHSYGTDYVLVEIYNIQSI